MVLANISVPRSLWPRTAIKLTRDIVIAGWTNRPTELDWQGAEAVLQLAGYTLKFREWRAQGGRAGPGQPVAGQTRAAFSHEGCDEAGCRGWVQHRLAHRSSRGLLATEQQGMEPV